MFWNSNVQKGDIDMFSYLQDIVANASVNTGELFAMVKELATSFGQYFPENIDLWMWNFWIVNSFAEGIGLCSLTLLRNNRWWNLTAISCWCPNRKTYHCHYFGYCLKTNNAKLSDKSIKLLLFFSKIYLCEKTFQFYLSSRLNRQIVWKLTLYYFVFQKFDYDRV